MHGLDRQLRLAAWGIYTVETNTMPRAYDYTDERLQAERGAHR